MIVELGQAKTRRQVAHAIANMYAYGLQPKNFAEVVETILEALDVAQSLPRDSEEDENFPDLSSRFK